nr:MBL fold metallo-hydrolase [Polymorphobacter multimanifer]
MSDASLTAYTGPVLGSPEAERAPEERRGLHYPFGRWVPEGGTLFEVVPGVHWLRMPLPFGLDHINLWALDAGDGWAIVDTGVNLGASKKHWEALFAGPMAGKPVTRVIVTHYHPDHLGLAGWLCARWHVPLEIARTEYLLARTLPLDVREAPPQEAVDFSIRAGWPHDAVETLRGRPWGNFSKIVHAMPAGFKRIRDGDVLTIGARQWTVVTGRGHSPEHSCLVSDEKTPAMSRSIRPSLMPTRSPTGSNRSRRCARSTRTFWCCPLTMSPSRACTSDSTSCATIITPSSTSCWHSVPSRAPRSKASPRCSASRSARAITASLPARPWHTCIGWKSAASCGG